MFSSGCKAGRKCNRISRLRALLAHCAWLERTGSSAIAIERQSQPAGVSQGIEPAGRRDIGRHKISRADFRIVDGGIHDRDEERS